MLRVKPSLVATATIAVAVTVAVGVSLISATAFADVPTCLQAAERAQPLRRAGQLRAAREALIVCSALSCPRAVRADCTQWLSEVEIAQPSVVIQARDGSGADIVDVTVSVDGVVRQNALDGLSVPVDPGTRVFRFEAPGRVASEQTLAIRVGEKISTVQLLRR